MRGGMALRSKSLFAQTAAPRKAPFSFGAESRAIRTSLERVRRCMLKPGLCGHAAAKSAWANGCSFPTGNHARPWPVKETHA